MKIALCIPTLNAGTLAHLLSSAIRNQTRQPDMLLVIDSGSNDGTAEVLKSIGARLYTIDRTKFNHGGTRQLAVEMVPDEEIIIFLTQDAVPAHPEAFENLLKYFDDEKVGAAYGRQLPRIDARPIEAHARIFNYPRESRVKAMADAPKLGIKTAFISNSFAAYRRIALMEVGGFPSNTILSEDTYVASKMLLSGWKIAYAANAMIYHSHDYGFVEEFKRYFDIGVFHAREAWIRQTFGQAEGEGIRYVRSEVRYLREVAPHLIPSALIRTVLKLAGYKLGAMEHYLPVRLKRLLSMHPQFWDT